MTTLTNSFEGLTSGTTLTQGSGGNTGGTSGSYFDILNNGSSGTLTADNTHAAHGLVSCHVATTATASLDFLEWTTQLGGTPGQLWFRIYAYLTAIPSANYPLARFLTSGASQCGRLVILASTGKITFNDGGNTVQLTSTNAIPTNAWFRIEGFVTGSATTGQLEFKLFTTMDSTSPLETQTSGSALNTTGAIGQAQLGLTSVATASVSFWVDDLGASTTGYIGPAVTSSLAVAPLTGPIYAKTPKPLIKGRVQRGSGVYNQVGPPVHPLPGPVGVAGNREPNNRPGRVRGISPGKFSQTGPPLRGLNGPPPYAGPVRSPLPTSFRKGGRAQSSPGVFNGVGPPLKPQSGPIRARILRTFFKGRANTTPPYVPPFVIIPATPAPPLHGPVGLGQRAPGPFRKGRVQSSAGTRQQTGPQLTPLQRPVRSRILRTWSKGHVQFNPGKYNQTGPPLTPLKGPVTARRPGPYRKGQVQSEAGVFNQIGPKVKALLAPVRAVFPGPFRKGRSAGNKGAPVFIPPPPPTQLNFVRPARPIRFGARLAQSRRRRWDPRWPQANQGQAWPSFTTQRGKHPRALLRLLPSKRRRTYESLPQANRGSAWPTAPHMGGSKPRAGARLRRGKFFIPTPPQANRGTPYFQPLKARPRRIVRTSVRGRVFRGWPQGNQGQPYPVPPKQAGKRPRAALRLLPSRRRRFDIPLPQSNRGAPYPTFTTPNITHRRFGAKLAASRRRAWSVVPPQANRGQAFASYIRGKGPKIRLLARLRQARGRRWLATYKHVVSTQQFSWNVEYHLISDKPFSWNVLNHVVSSIAIEWNVGTTVQSRPHLMTTQGWEQGTNAARLMTEEGKGYMGGGE